jgi:hypothetical protein
MSDFVAPGDYSSTGKLFEEKGHSNFGLLVIIIICIVVACYFNVCFGKDEDDFMELITPNILEENSKGKPKRKRGKKSLYQLDVPALDKDQKDGTWKEHEKRPKKKNIKSRVPTELEISEGWTRLSKDPHIEVFLICAENSNFSEAKTKTKGKK